MTTEEIIEHRRRWNDFAATEIGKLFIAYRYACQTYWQNDRNEDISARRLRELSDAEREAEEALVSRLMTDYGVIDDSAL